METSPSPTFSIRERQRNALQNMLSSSTSTTDSLDHTDDNWKVLIYDSVGRDIIAPLLRVAELRDAGVTLHMMLHASRHPIPDVPAVYFVQPTQENIIRISADASNNMYSHLSVNFTATIPRHLLETFGERISNLKPSAARISRVYDMYAAFLALEQNLFSLNLPSTYAALNHPKVSNSEVEACVTAIVDRLFCVIATLAVVPIIRAQKGGPAMLVAQMLDTRIRENLIASNNVFSEAGSFSASPTGRPLLVIVDRSIDLPVMLHHTWTYQALAHDALGLKLNRVTVSAKEANSSMSLAPQKRTYDLDKSDHFWAENAGLPFPMVAEAVEGALQAYKEEVAHINRSASNVGDNPVNIVLAESNEEKTANKLAAAISSIPELSKKKRTIDLHTNIATALLDQIKDRGLDGYFQVEEELLSRPSTFDVGRVLALFKDMKGTPTDKLRLFLIYYLCVDSASKEDLEKCVSTLEACGCSDMRAYEYLKSIRAFTKSISRVPDAPLASSTSMGSGYAASVLDTLSQVANNVNKLMISADKALSASRVVQTLMDQKGDAEILEGYQIFDPKAPKGSAHSSSSIRTCKDAILFVVGPGNYIEYQNCQDHVCSRLKQEGKTKTLVPNGKTVIYGSTELCTGTEFLEQLHLGGGSKASKSRKEVPTTSI